jgi:hypothetical protein
MLQKWGCVVLIFSCGVLAPRFGLSQDIHVYTTVTDEQGPQPQVVARSLSLFHGGKTYDYIDQVGEVIIFEPAARQFTLLNTRQMKAAHVLCEQLNGQLKVARQTLEASLEDFPRQTDPALWDQLQFQLSPKFQEERPQEGQLALRSESMRYQVRYVPMNTPEMVEKLQAYLNYADWTCRLNYVLHPGRIMPEPRLALNDALRKAQVMPTEVELIADVRDRIHLKAEHTIHLNLDEKDRELIHQWEQLLKSKELKILTFQEYQRAILVGQRK